MEHHKIFIANLVHQRATFLIEYIIFTLVHYVSFIASLCEGYFNHHNSQTTKKMFYANILNRDVTNAQTYTKRVLNCSFIWRVLWLQNIYCFLWPLLVNMNYLFHDHTFNFFVLYTLSFRNHILNFVSIRCYKIQFSCHLSIYVRGWA
jgi:hypothetical protein